MSATIWHHGRQFRLYVKGAPEAILAACRVSARTKKRAGQMLDEMTARGYRVIGLATGELDEAIDGFDQLGKLSFAGFVAVADVLRPEAPRAIRAALKGSLDLAVAAFAHHPEQGRLTIDDFQALTRQPWFNAAGLLVAHHDDEVAGFHWTKRHDANLGEVYVLAVRPGHGGAGLGRALLTAGLAHLHTVGCEDVELYVEASEERVVALYTATGFRTLNVDTAYRRGDTP